MLLAAFDLPNLPLKVETNFRETQKSTWRALCGFR